MCETTHRYFVGQGASYYVDATQAPWSEHFNMQSYIVDELYDLLRSDFLITLTVSDRAFDGRSRSIDSLGFKFPGKFVSVSAFCIACVRGQ